MSNFNKYSSLTNTYKQGDILKIIEAGGDKILWEVSEKIHGANFSFIITKDDIQIASRNGLIEGKFYNCKPVVEELSPAMRKLFDASEDVEVITVFGELYGDGVQQGVKYYDDQRFAAFDIMIDGEYVEPAIFYVMAELAGIPTVTSFGSMSFKDALEYPNQFVTKHSEDKSEDNVCEGVVLKPWGGLKLGNGSRGVLKNKNERYAEKAKQPKPKKAVDLSSGDMAVYMDMRDCVNENRISAVLSKESGLDFAKFGTYMQAVRTDVCEELEITEVPDPVRKKLDGVIAPLLRAELKRLI